MKNLDLITSLERKIESLRETQESMKKELAETKKELAETKEELAEIRQGMVEEILEELRTGLKNSVDSLVNNLKKQRHA